MAALPPLYLPLLLGTVFLLELLPDVNLGAVKASLLPVPLPHTMSCL